MKINFFWKCFNFKTLGENQLKLKQNSLIEMSVVMQFGEEIQSGFESHASRSELSSFL